MSVVKRPICDDHNTSSDFVSDEPALYRRAKLDPDILICYETLDIDNSTDSALIVDSFIADWKNRSDSSSSHTTGSLNNGLLSVAPTNVTEELRVSAPLSLPPVTDKISPQECDESYTSAELSDISEFLANIQREEEKQKQQHQREPGFRIFQVEEADLLEESVLEYCFDDIASIIAKDFSDGSKLEVKDGNILIPRRLAAVLQKITVTVVILADCYWRYRCHSRALQLRTEGSFSDLYATPSSDEERRIIDTIKKFNASTTAVAISDHYLAIDDPRAGLPNAHYLSEQSWDRAELFWCRQVEKRGLHAVKFYQSKALSALGKDPLSFSSMLELAAVRVEHLPSTHHELMLLLLSVLGVGLGLCSGVSESKLYIGPSKLRDVKIQLI